jgi:hypothetical protein
MSIRLEKPWLLMTQENINSLPGQLGVYELGDDSEQVIYIGQADARSKFGLRGEIQKHLNTAELFRCEVNMSYSTRYQELLMVFQADTGRLPELNIDTGYLGRLSPVGSDASRGDVGPVRKQEE